MVVLSTWFCKPPLGLVCLVWFVWFVWFGLIGLIDLVIWLFGFGFGNLVCVSVEINPLAWDAIFLRAMCSASADGNDRSALHRAPNPHPAHRR